jgi:ketosteroid isomerase-like protein
MKTWLLGVLSVAVITVVVLGGVRWSVANPHPTTADDLRKLEAELMKAAAERGADGYMSYYAEDAVEVPNGAAAVHGKANIARDMGFLNDKKNQLVWTPVDADISSAGDLGYTSGTFEFHSYDKNGMPTVDYGKYTSIWKKQSDGRWKVVLDMGNASPAPQKN